MNNSDYSRLLKKQTENSFNAGGIEFYLGYLYSKLKQECNLKYLMLELGAGAGISLKYLAGYKIQRTDLLATNAEGIQGGVDAQNLPFESNKFDLIIGMDFFHHIQNPTRALNEMKRVLKINGHGTQVMMIEPYVSLISYLPYKLFHDEETSLFRNRRLREPVVGPNASDGDQTLPRLYFCSSVGKKIVQSIFEPHLYQIDIQYISVLSFFITGGINRPLPTPIWLVQALCAIESRLPRIILRLAASRMIIRINRRSD
jgi:hypothetical protein